MLGPVLAASCTAGPPAGEQIGVARQALSGVGVTCDASAQCVSNAECWDNGTQHECHCATGYLACGTGCKLIGNDNGNCGYCGHACTGTAFCYLGNCTSSLPSDAGGYTVSMSSVYDMSADADDAGVKYDGGRWAHEADVEFSLNNGSLFGLNNYGDARDAGDAGGRDVNLNIADSGTAAWDTTTHHVTSSSGLARVDPTATTSGFSGLEYLAMLMNPNTGFNCIGGMANPASSFPSVSNEPTCANPHSTAVEGWDAPDLHYDPAGTTLWAAGNQPDGASAQIYVYRKNDCTGAIGSSSCMTPFDSALPTTKIVSPSHRLAVDRCSPGGVFVATRNTGAGMVTIVHIKPDLSLVSCTLDGSAYHAPNTNCYVDGTTTYDCASTSGDVCKCGATLDDCTGSGNVDRFAGKCLQHLPNVDLALLALPASGGTAAQCNLYAAYDASGTNPNGDTRFHARLRGIDVTNGLTVDLAGNCSNTSVVAETAEYQTFSSTIEVNEAGHDFGWYYHKDSTTNDDHCATVFQGRVDIDPTFASETIETFSTAAFPNIVTPVSSGMGDWVQHPHVGIPDTLNPMWAVPISGAADTGTKCTVRGTANIYNLKVRARRVTLTR